MRSTSLQIPFAGTVVVLVSVIITLFYVAKIIFHRQVCYCALSLCYIVYSKFGHHPPPLGYLCAKFHLFCDLHC